MSRKKKDLGQSKTEVLGVAVGLATKQWVEELAEEKERSMSYIGGALLERGKAAYERDGLLKEPSMSNGPALVSVPHSTATPRRKRGKEELRKVNRK